MVIKPQAKSKGSARANPDRRAEQAEAREKDRIAIEAFHQELARGYGLENHPKEPKLWALAWEHGHSAGYGEVRGYYHDFSELLT